MKRPVKEESKKVNENSRLMLVNKLKSLQTEANASIRELTKLYEGIVNTIRTNFTEVQMELETFVNYCGKCIDFIGSISELSQGKLFFAPIEQVLTSSNPNLDNYKGPELSVDDCYSRPFRLYLPTTVHLLNNYNWTVSLENDKIFVMGPNIIYNYEEFKQDIDTTTRYLIVSDTKVLFAGGVSWKDFSAFIDIQQNKARVLSKLSTGRYKHNLAWFDGHPAVFGGVSESGEVLSSVEILVNTEWKTHSNMLTKRCNLTAVTCLQTVYVVGGSSDHEGKHPLNNIEVWRGQWELLSVNLPCSICNVGVVNYGDMLYLLGGKNQGHEGTAVHKLSLLRNGLSKRLVVMDDFIFKNNSVVVAHFFIKGKCYKKQKSDTQIVVDFNVLTHSLEICKRY